MRFNVRSIPSILFFKNGRHVDTVIGAVPKPTLEGKIKQHSSEVANAHGDSVRRRHAAREPRATYGPRRGCTPGSRGCRRRYPANPGAADPSGRPPAAPQLSRSLAERRPKCCSRFWLRDAMSPSCRTPARRGSAIPGPSWSRGSRSRLSRSSPSPVPPPSRPRSRPPASPPIGTSFSDSSPARAASAPGCSRGWGGVDRRLLRGAPPVGALFRDLASVAGAGRRAVVARELTKMHEELEREPWVSSRIIIREIVPKGEVTIVLEGAGSAAPAVDRGPMERASALLADGQSPGGGSPPRREMGIPATKPIGWSWSCRDRTSMGGIALLALAAPIRRRRALPVHDRRPPAVRRRRRLVRQPVEPSEPARGDSRAHVAPRRRARSARHAHWTTGCGTIPFLHMTGHGNIQLHRRGGRARCASTCCAAASSTSSDNYGLDATLPARDRARLSRSSARRRAARRIRSTTSCTISRRACRRSTSTTASRRAGFGIFLGDRLAVYYGYQSDLGNGWEDPEVLSRPAGAARGGAAHGRESVRVRRGLRGMTAIATQQALAAWHARSGPGAG